jgi:class 3 adenylate cyclase
MIQGERVEAIIGLAKIKDFSTATEVLKARVMTFVNQIAEIVHGVVSEYHGAANKNNGDTFLVIWRISGIEDTMKSRLSDMSTIAFAKILGAVHRSPVLASYRGHPALQQRLGGNCRVCLTFGLHAGWAIEGAVGSEFKIDASYLSPNVSIATQVEQATSVYGVHILATADVVELCCEEIAAKYRKIDRVVIRGSADARCLFALDLDYSVLTIDDDMSSRPATWNSRWRFKARQFLEAEKQRKLDPEAKTLALFDQCKDIAHMRRRYSLEFIQLFNMGFQNYLEGEWPVAGRLLTDTRWMLRYEDGPSSALLRFMEGYHFQAPRSWPGFHDLSIFVRTPAS